MNILVTGGAGFIGSHLCAQLVRRGDAVTILDNMNDFYSPAEKWANVSDLREDGPVRFHQVDITDTKAVAEIMREVRPEIVVHLAARAGVRPSLEDPVLYAWTNVVGATNMLEESRKCGVRKFVFASSSSIYGIANRVPFSEEDTVNLPISPYAATKLAGEKLAYTYSHLYPMSIVCLRFFTVYGPRQRPDLAIRKFMGMIDDGIPLSVFGDGSSGRDYTYVSDTVAGILAAINYDCRFDVFNLGNSSPVTLCTLIAELEETVGRKAIIRRFPEQPGDVPITYADITKAQRLLGYEPRVGLREGLKEMAVWYRKTALATR